MPETNARTVPTFFINDFSRHNQPYRLTSHLAAANCRSRDWATRAGVRAKVRMDRMDTYSLTLPQTKPNGVLVEVPHAGLRIPSELEGLVNAPIEARRRDADLYVDELFADSPRVGATLLSAHLSRYIVDLNRGPEDIDGLTVANHPRSKRSRPRGVVWRMSTLGKPVIAEPLSRDEFETRLSRYYWPYHRELDRQIQIQRERFGQAIVVAAHSMPSYGPSRRGGASERRADIVPGTRGMTSANRDYIDLVETHFRDAGLTVAHDTPYEGGWTTGHYGKPAINQHVIQIEINRDLYLDERTHERKRATWPELQKTLISLVEALGHFQNSI